MLSALSQGKEAGLFLTSIQIIFFPTENDGCGFSSVYPVRSPQRQTCGWVLDELSLDSFKVSDYISCSRQHCSVFTTSMFPVLKV